MQVDLTVLIIACAGAAVLAGIICWFLAIGFRKKFVEAKIGSAESMARDIKNEALKAAEAMNAQDKEIVERLKNEKNIHKVGVMCCRKRKFMLLYILVLIKGMKLLCKSNFIPS